MSRQNVSRVTSVEMKHRTDQNATQPLANLLASSVKYVWLSGGQEAACVAFSCSGVAAGTRAGIVGVGVGSGLGAEGRLLSTSGSLTETHCESGEFPSGQRSQLKRQLMSKNSSSSLPQSDVTCMQRSLQGGRNRDVPAPVFSQTGSAERHR